MGIVRWFRLLATAIGMLPCLSMALHAQVEKRVALVIGNGEYRNASRLPNPRNDAEDVAAALRRAGFDVIAGVNLDKAGMDDAFVRFARAAREADIAMFYYSGHAMQFAGANYLMPVDAKLADEADLRRMARLDDVVADLNNAKNLRIMILDACRDNPLAEELKRSIGRSRAANLNNGLAKIDAPHGMIVAYATQAGRTADDGQGRNSPYTSAFLKHIEEPEEIGTVFRRISTDVYNATKRTQLPELSISVIGEFYLKGKVAAAQPAPVKPGPLSGQPFSAEVKAKHSNRCMDVAGGQKNPGRPIWQYGCNNSDAQRWDFVPDGGGYFSMKARVSGLCFDVVDGGTQRGILTWQQPCTGRDNQKFKLSPAGENEFQIQPKHAKDMCLDVYLALGTDQAPIIQWQCHSGDNQKWRFELR